MPKWLAAFLVLFLCLSGVTTALTAYQLYLFNHPRIPLIAGATADEQWSEPVIAGFAKGLQTKQLVFSSWGASWGVTALDVRDGMEWTAAHEKWAHADQDRRDDPIRRLMVRDLARFMPLDRQPTKEESRNGFLYLSAFASAFPDSHP